MSAIEIDDDQDDIEAWLDSALEKLPVPDLSIVMDDVYKKETYETPGEKLNVSASPGENLPADTFSNLIKSFEKAAATLDDLPRASDESLNFKGDENNIYMLYKDQLEIALSKRNLSMEEYLKTQKRLENDKIMNNNTSTGTYHEEKDDIDFEELKLDEDEIREVNNVGKWKSNTTESSSTKLEKEQSSRNSINVNTSNNPRQSELTRLMADMRAGADALKEIPRWHAEMEKCLQSETLRRQEIEKKEEERLVRARKQLDRLQTEMKARVQELTDSIDEERKKLEYLRELSRASALKPQTSENVLLNNDTSNDKSPAENKDL